MKIPQKKFVMEIMSREILRNMILIYVPQEDEIGIIPVYAIEKLDRPGVYVVPTEELVQWFHSNSLPLRLFMWETESVGLDGWEWEAHYAFVFDKSEDAMMFKLSWESVEENVDAGWLDTL